MILSFANFRTIGRSTVKVKWCGCDLLLRKDVSRLPNIWSKQWHGGKLDATTASFNFLHNFASLWEIGVGWFKLKYDSMTCSWAEEFVVQLNRIPCELVSLGMRFILAYMSARAAILVELVSFRFILS